MGYFKSEPPGKGVNDLFFQFLQYSVHSKMISTFIDAVKYFGWYQSKYW